MFQEEETGEIKVMPILHREEAIEVEEGMTTMTEEEGSQEVGDEEASVETTRITTGGRETIQIRMATRRTTTTITRIIGMTTTNLEGTRGQEEEIQWKPMGDFPQQTKPNSSQNPHTLKREVSLFWGRPSQRRTMLIRVFM